MMAYAALQGIQAVSTYAIGNAEARRARRQQKKNNQQIMKQAAHAQAVNLENSNNALDASVREDLTIQQNELLAQASAEVQAAAMGTTGQSVQDVALSIRRNASRAQFNREEGLSLQIRQFQENSMSINTAAQNNLRNDVFNGPSLPALVLDATSNTLKKGQEEGKWK